MTVKEFEVALVKEPDEAMRVYVPDRSILSPELEKSATPLVVPKVIVPPSVPTVLGLRDKVRVAEDPVKVLPPASWIAIDG